MLVTDTEIKLTSPMGLSFASTLNFENWNEEHSCWGTEISSIIPIVTYSKKVLK